MKLIICYTLLCGGLLLSGLARGQSIRKDYREFTAQEMTDYRAALTSLWNSGAWATLYNAHQMHFNTPIHTTGGSNNGEQFLSWHRFFLLDVEEQMRAANTSYRYLSIPYWNWTTDQNRLSFTFWDFGFLNLSNFSGWGITRPFNDPNGSLASPSDITATLALTTLFTNTTTKLSTSTDFSHRLEWYHDRVHNYVAGTMNSQSSPRDPVFYLHHNMVDRLWQIWEDASTGIQSSFPNGSSGMHHYTSVTLNAMRDSRSLNRPSISGSGRNMDVWFAENGKVLLDGANNTAFVCSDASASYVYRYVAATTPGGTSFTGDIFVGDIQRDASGNVIADNKGGFEINSSARVNFLAGREINFLPGFDAKSGSEMVAKIIATPNEAAPLQMSGPRNAPIVTLINSDRSDAGNSTAGIKVFPNPVLSKAYVQYSVKATASVFITMTDITGRTIRVTARKQREPGNYMEEVDMADLPAGVYMLNLQIGNQKNTFKLVK